MLPIKTILCPTDFSEPSYSGIRAADELAGHFSAGLILINVVTPVYPFGTPEVPPSLNTAEFSRELLEYAEKSMEKVKQEMVSENVEVKTIITNGVAAENIVKASEDEKVDLIVIATHGWTGWRRIVFGSVAEKVVRMATCPVTTIPQPEGQ